MPHVLPHVLATLAAVIALGWLFGRVCRRFGQPAVIGEIFAGIALGPTLLVAIAPEAMHWLVPDAAADPHGRVRTSLQLVAQLGVILYMFLVGLDLNGAKLKHHAGSAAGIALTAIAVSFGLGCATAVAMHERFAPEGIPLLHIALLLGSAMSVTAFPVLVRILQEGGWDLTETGRFALGCAAVDDLTAWCLLASIVGITQSQSSSALGVLAGAAAFLAVMYLVVRPLAGRFANPQAGRGANSDALNANGVLHPAAIPLTFVAVLLAALTTEIIGIHAVFGAFLLGVVIPHDSPLAREFTRRLKDVVTVLLLPAFFALAGLRTDLSLIGGWENLLIACGIIVVATLGKFGGTFAAAKFAGRDTRTAAALGAMMNTRGLMGLIVLDIGLNLGVISPTLFAMMVVMAIATTLATAPLLKRWTPPA